MPKPPKLKPCPFCGSKDIESAFMIDRVSGIYVAGCPKCETYGPQKDTPELANRDWNRRK